MSFGPPVLPGSAKAVETPADRAISLYMAGELEASLRWAAAIVKADAHMATALLLCGRLLGDLNRNEVAREASAVAVDAAIDIENLPLAAAAAHQIDDLGGDAGTQFDAIADAFCDASPRRGEGARPPEQLPAAEDFHPLPSVLTGALLLNKATEIVREAKKKNAGIDRPGISPHPLFSRMSKQGLDAFCRALVPTYSKAGDVVIEQGQAGTDAYFVARGELEVRRQKRNHEVTLATLQGGAIFGEMALLARSPRTGSVVALRPCITLRVSKESLDELAHEQPDIGAEIAHHCRERMVQNLLRMSEVLRVVPEADRPALVEQFKARAFEKNERIIVQDEPPPGLFLIASGEVAVVRRETGDPLVIATLGVGDVVGEVALIFRRRSQCDVVALHPTITLYLPADSFLSLIREHPSILSELYLLAVARDEETSNILEEEASDADDFVII